MSRPHPRTLPVDDIAARFSRAGIELSMAAPAEYDEVEALARRADPHEVFAPLTAPLLSWFTEENPHGPGFLVVARSREDRAIAGHFLFYATTLVHGGDASPGLLPAYLYVHLYVAPAWRRAGVFAGMFGFGQDVLRRMAIPFSYTVPNPRSSPGFAKFGVPWLGTLPCWMAPAWRVWRACASLTSWGRGVDVARVSGISADMCPARRTGAEVEGVRTPDTLHWRFGRRPGADYGFWRIARGGRVAGYAVTRMMSIQGHRVLALCDLWIDRCDASVIRETVAAIIAQSPGEHPGLVMFQGGPPARDWRRALWKAGLVHVPDRLLPQPVAVFGGAPGEPGATAGLPMLDRWHLTPGDWDVF